MSWNQGSLNIYALSLIPTQAGIQRYLNFWIPGRASYRQLAPNDDLLCHKLKYHD